MKTLRQRLRDVKINCRPWKHWKEELKQMPISSKTLFAKKGEHSDILEITLREEGYLQPEENLTEVLKNESRLYMTPSPEYNSSFGNFPEDWTEEDYREFEKSKINQ